MGQLSNGSAALASLAPRVQPTVLAEERALPVLEPLQGLLPRGLQRGTSVQVDGVREGVGSTSLALALAAGPSAAGSWVAAVGVPSLGLAAAAGYGIDLRRFVLVPDAPAEAWGTVVATLLDAFEVVLVRSLERVRAGVQRRLQAMARERGSVLVRLGDGWVEAADTSLRVVSTEWHGLGQGAGHLRARRATVEAGGRRGNDRPRRVDLWLPAPGGALAVDVDGGGSAVAGVPRSAAGVAESAAGLAGSAAAGGGSAAWRREAAEGAGWAPLRPPGPSAVEHEERVAG